MSNIQVLGSLKGANLNLAGDQKITIGATKYVITDLLVTNASVAPSSTLVGDLYSAKLQGGSKLTTSFNSNLGKQLSGLTTPQTFWEAMGTLGAGVYWNLVSYLGFGQVLSGDIYLNISTPNGAPCTVDLYVLGFTI